MGEKVKPVNMSAQIQRDLYEEAKRLAARHNLPLSHFIRELLRKWVEENGPIALEVKSRVIE
jgi:antitoxin component of RelBE/YafQ-DinJ toxin-antitoxin module